MLEELIKRVRECDDVIAVRNAFIEVLENINPVLDKDEILFDAVRSAYCEVSDCNYTEELAGYYYAIRDIDPSVMEDAKSCYNRRCKDVNVWDWCVLYGRMSLNTKDHEGRINACNVFLSNGIKACFMPTYM